MLSRRSAWMHGGAPIMCITEQRRTHFIISVRELYDRDLRVRWQGVDTRSRFLSQPVETRPYLRSRSRMLARGRVGTSLSTERQSPGQLVIAEEIWPPRTKGKCHAEKGYWLCRILRKWQPSIPSRYFTSKKTFLIRLPGEVLSGHVTWCPSRRERRFLPLPLISKQISTTFTFQNGTHHTGFERSRKLPNSQGDVGKWRTARHTSMCCILV
jgi:hypothetical protein